MRRRVFMLIALAAAIAAVVSTTCLFAGSNDKVDKAKKSTSEDVSISSKHYVSKWGGDENTTLLSGSVKFIHLDTTLTSDKVLYDGKAHTAESPGAVRITDPECDITGDKGFSDFKKRLGTVEGDVVMLMKPKLTPEEEKARQDKDSNDINAKLKESTTITCSKLEYQYKKKIATATGGVKFKQKSRTASADKAVYDVKNEVLTLVGHVHAVDEDGQTFDTPDKVVISLKKGSEQMEGTNFSGSFKIDMED